MGKLTVISWILPLVESTEIYALWTHPIFVVNVFNSVGVSDREIQENETLRKLTGISETTEPQNSLPFYQEALAVKIASHIKSLLLWEYLGLKLYLSNGYSEMKGAFCICQRGDYWGSPQLHPWEGEGGNADRNMSVSIWRIWHYQGQNQNIRGGRYAFALNISIL